jgi:ABC-type nitrate/sulfonate/bicarbonate transport system ATPase subunit
VVACSSGSCRQSEREGYRHQHARGRASCIEEACGGRTGRRLGNVVAGNVVLSIRRILHRYREAPYPVVDLIDCAIPERSIASLTAASGMGKTTLFRLLLGWFDGDIGTIVDTTPSFRASGSIWMVGGHPSLLPWLSVGQNLRFFLPRSSSAEAVDLLGALGLQPSVGQMHPYQLSAGMYKRVELVIALLRRPEVLLLDEFFSSLDASARDLALEALHKHRTGHLTWISGHEVHLADWLGGVSYQLEANVENTVIGLERV